MESKHAFRAGLVVIIGVAVGVAFFIASRKSTLDDSNSEHYYALLEDVAGVNAKSLITVAGLQVGEIADIYLVETTTQELHGHARADVEAQYQQDLEKWWHKRSERLAGEGHDAGPLPPGGELPEHDDRDGFFNVRPKPPPKWEPERKIRVARVDMRIIRDVKIPKDSWLKKESLGLLGAKALFLDLGSAKELVGPGGRIINVRSVTQLDAITKQAEEMVASVASIIETLDRDLGGIVADIKGVTGTINRFVSGDGENPPLDEMYEMVLEEMRKAARTIDSAIRQVDSMLKVNDRAVSGLITNMERISSDIAELTGSPTSDGGPGGELRETVTQVKRITNDLADITAALKDVVGENEGEINDSVKELKHTLGELNRSLTSLAEVTGRIERGEGTVGRLLTDERIADKVEQAVAGASDFVTGLTSLETHVDLATWYNVRSSRAQVAFELKLQPKPDKYYLIGIVDDGGGIERLTETFNVDDDNDPNTSARRSRIRENDNSLRFTAMFAKKFWDFLVLRAGLLETSGAVGANMLFWDDRIELRTDLFNFGGPRNLLAEDLPDPIYADIVAWPRWRTMLKLQPIPHLYVMGGVDDVLNFQPDPAAVGYGFDYFFGAGITFKDDDLRSILPFVPSF